MKPYLIDWTVGNGRLLVTGLSTGEIVRAWWPNIDYGQHIEQCKMYIRNPAAGSTSAIDSTDWLHEAHYIGDTNIIVSTHSRGEQQVQITDFVHPEHDVLIRRLQFKQLEGFELGLWNDLQIEEQSKYQSVLFDLKAHASLHYFRNVYIHIGADCRPSGFQAGASVQEVREGRLNGNEITLGSTTGLSWTLKSDESLTLFYVFSENRAEGIRQLEACRREGGSKLLHQTENYWQSYLADVKGAPSAEPSRTLYFRSQLVFALMQDRNTGGLVAAPEFDPDYQRCGGYAYCWGRDAAYITTAIERSGFLKAAESFYEWAKRVQDPDGSWDHRYYMNGLLAPAWGYQADEPASLIWGMWQHYQLTKDLNFLMQMADSILNGCEHLLRIIDPDTRLPKPTHDLWEERFAEHVYSAGAVAAALRAGAEAAKTLNRLEQSERFRNGAEQMASEIEKLWNAEKQCFYRGIRWHVDQSFADQAARSGKRVGSTIDSYGYKRYFIERDETVDVSLLGLSYPFEVIPASHPKMKATAAAIEKWLTSPNVGGIKRYEDDRYVGGNPWILATLWLGLYFVKLGETDRAIEYLRWAEAHRTQCGLLPEQIDRVTGQPAWVVPLTWSHAMYVLLVQELCDAGVSL